MFTAIKDNKIIAICEKEYFPCLVYDEIKEDKEHQMNHYMIIDDEYVLLGAERTVEQKKKLVREVREQYFEKYVDFYQSKPLLWEEMTEEEKVNISNYRQYLKDYTKEENWWEQNPKSFDEWNKKGL